MQLQPPLMWTFGFQMCEFASLERVYLFFTRVAIAGRFVHIKHQIRAPLCCHTCTGAICFYVSIGFQRVSILVSN